MAAGRFACVLLKAYVRGCLFKDVFLTASLVTTGRVNLLEQFVKESISEPLASCEEVVSLSANVCTSPATCVCVCICVCVSVCVSECVRACARARALVHARVSEQASERASACVCACTKPSGMHEINPWSCRSDRFARTGHSRNQFASGTSRKFRRIPPL